MNVIEGIKEGIRLGIQQSKVAPEIEAEVSRSLVQQIEREVERAYRIVLAVRNRPIQTPRTRQQRLAAAKATRKYQGIIQSFQRQIDWAILATGSYEEAGQLLYDTTIEAGTA